MNLVKPLSFFFELLSLSDELKKMWKEKSVPLRLTFLNITSLEAVLLKDHG